jgi:DnaJ-class molecular chaperone
MPDPCPACSGHGWVRAADRVLSCAPCRGTGVERVPDTNAGAVLTLLRNGDWPAV